MFETGEKHVYVYLTVVRHGETRENKEQIIQGHLDTVLSEVGLQQARELAASISNLSIDTIISSDLSRAYKTAESLRDGYTCSNSPPIFSNKLMRERNFGVNNGKSRTLVHKFIAQTKDLPASCQFWRDNGGECIHEVSWRALQFLFSLCQTVNNLPIRAAPVFSNYSVTSLFRLPLFLPLPIPPASLALAQNLPTVNCSKSDSLPNLSNREAVHPQLNYAGHIVLVSHGQWIREFMHLLRTKSEITVGFPSADKMMPVLNNCQFYQFGLLFRPEEMSLYAETMYSILRTSARSSSISRCPYQLELTEMPMRAACYHMRLSSKDVTGGCRVTKESATPEPDVEIRQEASSATSGVETLYFISEDDEYAGLPFLKN